VVKFRFSIVFVICCLALYTTGQQDMRFYHLSEKDGLTDNTVTCFYKDRHQVMWLGTAYGLNRFDGSEIINYHSDTGQYALPSDDIRCLLEDSTGTLWIGTASGLCSYQPDKRVFKNYSNLYTPQLSKGINTIAIVQHTLYIGTNYGLQLFDTRKSAFILYENPNGTGNEYGQNNHINHIYIDKSKHLWLSTYNGLWLFNPQKKLFYAKATKFNDSEFDGLVLKADEDAQGNVWFGTWSKGIKKYIPSINKVESYTHLPFSPTCANDFAWQMVNGQRCIWITKDLTLFNPASNQFNPLISHLEADISYQGIHQLYSDADGLLWIASQNGIYMYNPARSFFKHLTLGQVPITSQVVVLYPQQKNILVGGQDRSALFSLSNDLAQRKDYSSIVNFKHEGIQHHPAVLNITQDPILHDHWVCTSDGLLQMDESFKTIKHIYTKNKSVQGSIPLNFINQVFFTHDHQMLFFPWRKGIWEMDQAKNICRPFPRMTTGDSTIMHTNINKAIQDSFHHIWFANIDGSLICYQTESRQFQEVIGNIRISNIHQEGRRLWVVTDKIIYSVDCATLKTQRWNIPVGINKYIYDFIHDGKGHLWLASKSGLLVFYTHTGHFRTYTAADGLRSDNMNGSICKLGDGTILFAADKYCTSFHPSIAEDNRPLPFALLAEIYIDGKPVINDESQLEFKHNVTNFMFKWALPDYQVPLQNHYYCLLEGVDKSWRYTGNKGSIEYFSLLPGTYKFRYKASTSEGMFSKEQQLTFVIYPPFWKTWWFASLCGVLVLAIIYIIFRNRIKSIKRKAETQSILKDMEMKALRAQMNPHFIFNALNSIKESILSGNEDEATRYLDKFSKLIRMVLENSLYKQISLQQEIAYLQLYLEMEVFRFEELQFTLECDEQLHKDFIHIPPMLVQPFVENALKHGLAHLAGRKQLNILFSPLSDTELKVLIIDNGIGRKHSAEINKSRGGGHRSLGLKITEERLQLSAVASNQSVTIKDLYNKDGEAMGTEVTLIISLKQ
jgi:ligand-binding sensor domain-containing protein